MTIQHVLFIVTNAATIGPHGRKTGFFFPEVAHPWHELEAAGVSVEFASPKGGAIPEDGYDEKDPQQRGFKESKAYRRLNESRKLSEVDVTTYDAIFFPGGLGPMVDIATDPDVKRAVRNAWDANMIVAAVCHGPVALLGVKNADGTPFLKGHTITAFTNAEEAGYAKDDVPFELETALREDGAAFEKVAPWQPKIVVDGRLMTGQNPASAGPLAKAMIPALKGTYPPSGA